ncbi:MAG: phosphoenolpyruvate carboxykinase (GTP) [Candidatus Krumholzibacteriota bacterium]|nr:phosphoenolpyruvate carboxykinase (GTP) [Candidatus Krumholzibacteriota bacterium]
MNDTYRELLQRKMVGDGYEKLVALGNAKLYDFVGESVALCEPDSVYLCDDSDEDAEYVRRTAVEMGEERPLARNGQTIHYDGYGDQARDKENTRYMVSRGMMEEMTGLNCIEHDEGLAEIRGIARGIMRGKQAIVKLFCEGPPMSAFAVACAQITDSFYVSHSEDILYRRGFEHFRRMADKNDFFRFLHSAGRLDERGCSVDLGKRRIYQDLVTMTVYSMNDQYAGNSIGLKKHAMRLAIKKSGQEGWLCEHMFVMGCRNHRTGRITHFCGAYPSACGKTSTAMLPGETIVGDDIAYFRNIDGEFRAVNVERGIFGIIRDVNPEDDPVIFRTLQSEREMIFSNVLVGPDGNPYWLGMGVETPDTGENHSGPGWHPGKKDANGAEIPIAHSNSRYTIRMQYLENLDPSWNDREGVRVGGIIYGGRDGDTSVPVEESPDWEDGIVIKACTLESETTAATLGAEGVRKPQPMANLDFISYPIGDYVRNNIAFGQEIADPPRIFAMNYFLRGADGAFCSCKLAKRVWLHWAEGRVHGEYDALRTPTGFIPVYEDLRVLFDELLGKPYGQEDYEYQFSFRCDAWLAKIERAEAFFRKRAPKLPRSVFDRWADARRLIEAARVRCGGVIPPGTYTG